jgi:hypothetical protein
MFLEARTIEQVEQQIRPHILRADGPLPNQPLCTNAYFIHMRTIELYSDCISQLMVATLFVLCVFTRRKVKHVSKARA